MEKSNITINLTKEADITTIIIIITADIKKIIRNLKTIIIMKTTDNTYQMKKMKII